jgi:hypothetical protein
MATIKRYESIEIIIPSGATNTRFYFPDLPNLRNALIDKFILYSAAAINPSVLTGGNVAPIYNILQSSLTLYNGDQQFIYNNPLSSLINLADSFSGESQYYNIPLEFNGQIISWTKSYITSPYPQDSDNVVFSFGVFYHF